MKTKLNVFYCTEQYCVGFKFIDYKPIHPAYILLGEIEIDNPFDVPGSEIVNGAKVDAINTEIKEYLAKINLLENAKKDLLCIEVRHD